MKRKPPVVEEGASVVEEEVPVVEEEVSVAEDEGPVMEAEVSAVEEEAAVAKEEIPEIEEEAVSVIEEEAPVVEKEAPFIEAEEASAVENMGKALTEEAEGEDSGDEAAEPDGGEGVHVVEEEILLGADVASSEAELVYEDIAFSEAALSVAEAYVVDEVFEEVATLPDAGADNDALFEIYLEQVLPGLSPGRGNLRVERALMNVAREKLEEDQSLAGTLAIYDALRPMIRAVARGESTSTVFSVPDADQPFADHYWTAEDLGGESLEGTVSAALLAKEGIKSSALLNALLSDCPYDLFWFDKTKGVSMSYSIRRKKLSTGEVIAVGLTGITYKMTVARDYAATTTEGDTTYYETYQVNSLPARVSAAVDNINGIISANASKETVARLTAYANAVCSLVEYNHSAADDKNTPYGDPWQLVYIFDGEPDTKVVCEGYSKGFKYLCDLSDFGNNVDCILATGTMQGGTGAGAHMWNIVHLSDGRYYLVDLTNCDGGNTCTGELFLKGSSGSGTTYSCGRLKYVYDETTLATYGSQSAWLGLSAYDYGEHYRVDIETGENSGIVAQPSVANAGTTVTLTLAENSGSTFDEPVVWQGLNIIVPEPAGGNAWSFTMPNGDVTVTTKSKTVTDPTIELSASTYTYDGTAKRPSVTVKDGDVTIPASEYTVSYSNNINAGTATVTVTDNANGYYDVSGSTTFTIAPKTVGLTWSQPDGDLRRRDPQGDGEGDGADLGRHLYGDGDGRKVGCGQLHGYREQAEQLELRTAWRQYQGVYNNQIVFPGSGKLSSVDESAGKETASLYSRRSLYMLLDKYNRNFAMPCR